VSITPPIAAEPMRELASASRKEVAMWLLERLYPEGSPNNLSLVFETDSALDVGALRVALEAIVRRHEVLRTIYFAAGAELMKTVLPADRFRLEFTEFEVFAPQDGDVERALRPFINRHFTMNGQALVRAGLFHGSSGDVCCVVFHHFVYDVISAMTLLDELGTAYNHAAAHGLVPDELLATVTPYNEPDPSPASLDFWRAQLDGFDPGGLDLRCGVQDSGRVTLVGDQVTRLMSARARENVRKLQRELRAPEAVILLAAYLLLLAAHGAGPDLLVGSPVNARPPEDPRLVGHHTNVLPLRLRTDPAESFRDWTLRTRDVFFAALAHADVPVDSVPDLLPQVGMASWGQRVFRYLFNYVPGLGLPDFSLGTTTARQVPVDNGYNKFDLEFFVAVTPEALRVAARYGVDRLRREDAEALLLRYEALLEALPEIVDSSTGTIPVWSAADTAVVEEANATSLAMPHGVVEAVYDRAVSAPDAPAVVHGDRTVSYRQLWHYATTIAHALAEAGIRPGDIVALAASRTPELLGAALGTWLAGAAYLPVDPEHPAERISYLLSDSGARLVLTDRTQDVPEGAAVPAVALLRIPDGPQDTPLTPPLHGTDPDALAYLIYTSGTSGRPKGALITHRSIANIAADYTIRLAATTADATLWLTTFAFDMANLEIYMPLYSGGRIVIAPDEARTDGGVLAAELRRHCPGIVQATPTTLRLVLDGVANDLAGTRVITGGETVPAALARQLLATGCELHHAYGPTETVTWCTWAVVDADPGDRLHIGRPISKTRVMVMAPDGRELPVGVRGELCIAGHGVALGYHRQPLLTAERFGTHPVHGRYYRSGDLGQWRADGTLELFGRADRQIKLHGNRIELGEVEAVLLSHAGVRVAAVVLAGASAEDAHLVAFVEPEAGWLGDGATDLAETLWVHARSQMPRAALPQRFVLLDTIPVSANEKVDYATLQALARQDVPTLDSAADRLSSSDDPLCDHLVALWKELLARDDVSAETNFFTHGGHSLLGAQLLQRLETDLETDCAWVKLADLFTAPTPLALTERIRSGG
jgi:amino acid adenylation domain-containing protein